MEAKEMGDSNTAPKVKDLSTGEVRDEIKERGYVIFKNPKKGSDGWFIQRRLGYIHSRLEAVLDSRDADYRNNPTSEEARKRRKTVAHSLGVWEAGRPIEDGGSY